MEKTRVKYVLRQGVCEKKLWEEVRLDSVSSLRRLVNNTTWREELGFPLYVEIVNSHDE